MREAKLLYRSLAWRTITLARLRATDASGMAKGEGHGTDNTCTSTTSHGGGGEEVVQAGRYCGGGQVWHRKNLVVFVDVVGVVSARRNDESLPRLSVCCSGYAAAVTVRSLALWIHEGQGQSESPSDAGLRSAVRSAIGSTSS